MMMPAVLARKRTSSCTARCPRIYAPILKLVSQHRCIKCGLETSPFSPSWCDQIETKIVQISSHIGEGDDDAGRVGEEEDVVLHGTPILKMGFPHT